MSCKPISVEVQRGILRLSLFVFLSFLIIKKETKTFELKQVCFINRRETLCINKAVFFDHIVFQRGNQSARVVYISQWTYKTTLFVLSIPSYNNSLSFTLSKTAQFCTLSAKAKKVTSSQANWKLYLVGQLPKEIIISFAVTVWKPIT